jgi:protein-S-isoprenylcysteine O-methyltransferase Ste14
LGSAFAGFYLWQAKPTATSILAGLALAIPGLALRAVASGYLHKNEQLAMAGPYAHTRNPLYLGSIILASGFALAARSWLIAGAAAVFFIAIYLPVIRAEEAFLRTRFPPFEEYARRVPSLFPRWRRASNHRGRFSWDLYCKHREYNSILGSAVLAILLVAKLIWLQR